MGVKQTHTAVRAVSHSVCVCVCVFVFVCVKHVVHSCLKPSFTAGAPSDQAYGLAEK